jgi:hypothetical protein
MKGANSIQNLIVYDKAHCKYNYVSLFIFLPNTDLFYVNRGELPT